MKLFRNSSSFYRRANFHTEEYPTIQILESVTTQMSLGSPNSHLTMQINKFPEYIPSSNFDKIESKFTWPYFSLTRRLWEYVIYVTSLIIPIEMSFVFLFDNEISVTSYSVFFFIDFLQLLDNIVILFTPFLRHGILVSDMKEILKNYGYFSYAFHVFASLPLGWIGVIEKDVLIYAICSLNRLLRLHQAYRSYHIIRDSTFFNHALANLITPLFLMLFIVHFFACVLYASGKYITSEESWIDPFVQQGYSSTQMYVVSLYFVMTTVLTLGYGDIHPVSTPEVIISIFIVITGVIIQGSILANMINAFTDRMGIQFITQYNAMQDYMKQKKLPDKYREAIRLYFQTSWEKNHGAPSWNSLLSKIPKSIQSGIKLEFCKRTLSGMPLFSCVGQKYLLMIMNHMTPFTYLPDQIICTQEEPVSDLLIFNHGIIQLILNDVPLASLNVDAGYVDGERQLMFGRVQDKTIKALTYVDGWRLKRKDFLELINSRKNLKTLLLMNAKARFPKDFEVSTEWDVSQMVSEDEIEPDIDSDEEEEFEREEDFIYVDPSSSSSSDEQFTDADL